MSDGVAADTETPRRCHYHRQGKRTEGVAPMSTITQSTTVRTVEARNGAIIPATIDQQTDMNFLAVALSVYHRFNGRRVAWDTACKVCDAMRDSFAVVTL